MSGPPMQVTEQAVTHMKSSFRNNFSTLDGHTGISGSQTGSQAKTTARNQFLNTMQNISILTNGDLDISNVSPRII
jgi:hypothetical protein